MEAITISSYQGGVSRTAMPDSNKSRLISGLGVAGEAGELADLIKKLEGHGHPLTEEMRLKLAKEVGDVSWYLADICNKYGLDWGSCLLANLEKLRKRYPDGFNTAASIARVDTEV